MSGGPGAEGGKSGPSNLTLRLVSGAILAVVALALTYLGGVAFRLFAVLIAVMVFREWLAMRRPGNRIADALGWAALAAALAVMLAGASAPISFAVLAAAFTVNLAHALVTGGDRWGAWGIAYAGLPALALAFMRGSDEAGLIAILFLYAAVWGTDVLAYFVGRSVGGPKLAPSISPGKTWSGAIGGGVSGAVAGTAVIYFTGAAMQLGVAFVLAFLLSVASQAGDLFESAVKRRHGVKDSGTIIPGHGGVMDRVDGLVAAAILLYVLGTVFAGPAGPFSR
jgi:phosphatidate cytidylyltransferase